MNGMITWLKQEYEYIFEERSGKKAISCGKIHKYLGMTLDSSTPGKIKITMLDYVNEIFAEIDAADPTVTGTKHSATSGDLFKGDNTSKIQSTYISGSTISLTDQPRGADR